MIYIVCSTIRPKMFIDTHNDWMSKVDNASNVTTKLVVDTTSDAKQLRNYDCMICDNNTHGITTPLYALTKTLTDLNDDDVIILLSDDFYPPEHWDTFILNQFSDFTGGLLVCDGHSNLSINQVVTIPILDYRTLKLLNNVIYHPDYIHMYSDNELFSNLHEMGLLKNIFYRDDYTFEHRHYHNGKREKDEFDDVLFDNSIPLSTIIYNQRMLMGLPERLLVNDYNSKLVRGQNIVELADHVLMYYNKPYSKLVDIKDGDIVYCDTRSLHIFKDVLMLRKDLVIITHNCDGSIGDHPVTREIDVNINEYYGCFRKWFTTNSTSSNKKVIPIPIGFENRRWDKSGEKTQLFNSDTIYPEPIHDVYLNCGDINTHISDPERLNTFNECAGIDVVTIEAPNYSFTDYMDRMSQFKFVISPHGGGFDCHRTWETLFLGRIPILKRSQLSDLYSDLPVLFVDNWSDILTIDLDAEYDRLIGFDRVILTQEYWNNKITENI